MIWDARKLSDRSYHRRRLVLFAALVLIGSGLLVIRVADIAERGWQTRDFLSIAWIGIVIYAVLMAKRELRAMQHQ